MKRYILIGTLMVLITGASYTAHAEMSGDHAHKAKTSHSEYWASMNKTLSLSDTQKEQIKSIIKAEKQKNSPLMKRLAENSRELRKVMLAGTFDESKIRPLAENQGRIKADLIVSRAKVRSQILAVLTPEQREKAEKMKPFMGRHRKAIPDFRRN